MSKNAALFAKLKADKQAKRDAARAALADRIEAARPDAAVALDAWIDAGRPMWTLEPESVWQVHKIFELEDLALDAYKLVHPSARGAKGFVYRAHVKASRWSAMSRRQAVKNGGTIACRYCGVRLILDAELGGYYGHDSRVAPHVTECALSVLAGLRIPVGPGAEPDERDREVQP